MNLQAHLQPNRATLVYFLFPAFYLFLAASVNDSARWFTFAAGVFMLLLYAVPLVASAVFRVPVVRLDAEGVRLPLQGPDLRVAWADVTAVRAHEARYARWWSMPTIELDVVDPSAVIRAARWRERGTMRRNVKVRGTPLVILFARLDQPMMPFLAAIETATGLTATPISALAREGGDGVVR